MYNQSRIHSKNACDQINVTFNRLLVHSLPLTTSVGFCLCVQIIVKICSAISGGRRSCISVIKEGERNIAAQSKAPSVQNGKPHLFHKDHKETSL